MRERLAVLGASDDVLLHFLRRRWGGEEVEAANRQVQIPNCSGLAVHMHEVQGCIVTPPELAFQPRQRVAVTGAMRARGIGF
jgi:hypothetical protein